MELKCLLKLEFCNSDQSGSLVNRRIKLLHQENSTLLEDLYLQVQGDRNIQLETWQAECFR